MGFGAAIQLTQAQGEHFGGEAAFLLLEVLVAASRGGLTLQVTDLFLDFVANVLQSLEVLAGVADAIFGFLAALLVTGDAGRLFDEGAHVFGLALDDTGDHALLDDRVAARAEAGAEEQLRDVLAAAADAVQVVIGAAITFDLTFERDLVVTGVSAPKFAVRVVEDQLDGGGAHGFARRGAVEDDVRHRVAAQMFRGQLTHDPAHGVDDVRLAAAVGADDAGEITGEGDVGGIDEGLETGELDLGQPHLLILT